MKVLAEAMPRKSARKEKRTVRFDPYRSILFPNALRARRKDAGYPTLLTLSAKIPNIPYIRLSKIERGEVFARADELVSIAAALGIAPDMLLVDIDAPAFSIEEWADGVVDESALDLREEQFAVMLAAALRVRRGADKALTIAAIEQRFGLPPVILSRIENAQKVFDRWNRETQQGLCGIFGVANAAALRKAVTAMFERGDLDAVLPLISSAELRTAKTRAKLAELRQSLEAAPPGGDRPNAPSEPTMSHTAPASGLVATIRMLPVFGAPLGDGLSALQPTGDMVEAPQRAGARAFGLRIFRSALGAGLPPHSVLIVDPDRYPAAGGLAAIREGDAYRILSVSLDRSGATIGYSLNPDRELRLDDLDIGNVAAVLGAVFP